MTLHNPGWKSKTKKRGVVFVIKKSVPDITGKMQAHTYVLDLSE